MLSLNLEGLDVGIHVRHGHHPVEVVIVMHVGVGGQSFFCTPAIQEATPEEIADRDAIRLFMPDGLMSCGPIS
jgi:hypothetical protein